MKKKQNVPTAISLGVLIVFFLGAIWFLGVLFPSEEAEKRANERLREEHKVAEQEQLEEDLMSAWAMCQELTEERLVSPASAEWPWDNRPHTKHLGAGRFQVKTHVDSQNRFGAMLRAPVNCVVQKKGTSWRLESLSME